MYQNYESGSPISEATEFSPGESAEVYRFEREFQVVNSLLNIVVRKGSWDVGCALSSWTLLHE
jgi:hypothetical protein